MWEINKITRLNVFLIILLGMTPIVAQNDFLQFENFRRGHASVDVSILANNQSSVAANVSYRLWDWSLNLQYQNGIRDGQDYSLPVLDLESGEVVYKDREIGLMRNLQIGIDRKIFQLGDEFYFDIGLSLFGINRPSGITESEKKQLEADNFPFDKSNLEFDFGMSLGGEFTLYVHRYIGLIGGFKFENTFRDIRHNILSSYLGFKFYVK